MRWMALLLVAACGSKTDEPAPQPQPTRSGSNDKLAGALRIDGKPVTLRACKPGHAVHTFVDVSTSGGTLRFEDGELYLARDPDATTRGDKLACDRLDRSWGGGTRTDGTSYFRGKLDFACGAVTGALDLECGGLTTAERLQLESNRQDMLSEKRTDRTIVAGPFSTQIPDGWIDVAASGDPTLGKLAGPGQRALVVEHPPAGERSAILIAHTPKTTLRWSTCEELARGLPNISLTEAKLTADGEDRTCTWKLSFADQRGRMGMRVHQTDALIVQLIRTGEPDAEAGRAFDQVLAKVTVK